MVLNLRLEYTMAYRRRYGQRPRRRPRRAKARRNPMRRSKFAGKGVINIKRKMPLISLNNVNNGGTGVVVYDVPSTSVACLTAGTPVLQPQGVLYDVPFSLQFAINQAINYTEITNLCDQYKLKYIKVLASYSTTNYNSGFNGAMPFLEWIVDTDDASVPFNFNIREKTGTRISHFGMNRPAKCFFKPKVAVEVYKDSVTSSGYAQGSPWINSTNVNVIYYGIKGVLHNMDLRAGSQTTLNGVFSELKFDITQYIAGKDLQ